MANKDGGIKRSDNGINIYITPEEKDQLDAICEYLGISRSQFVRITSDVIYERVLMNNYNLSFEELEAIGKRHGVGYGVVMDLCNIYE